MVRFRPHLAEHGLTEQQWRVIRAVYETPGIEATVLSDQCCILLPSLSRILKALEHSGILVRQQASADKRRQIISLSSEGLALFLRMTPRSEEIYAEIEDKFGKENLHDLLQAMNRLQQAIDD